MQRSWYGWAASSPSTLAPTSSGIHRWATISRLQVCYARCLVHVRELTVPPVSANNLRFELANILFNLAVLYCQLANNSNRTTGEGLKAASNYYCAAAGVFSHLRADVVPDMRSTAPDDMDPWTLESAELLMLAQAQECFWQKAVKDGLKDATISKLAARVSDLYLQAAENGAKSSAITSEWIHHMYAKHNHFAAAAQYRAACDCLEKRKYGEEVTRLQDSLNCVHIALKEARYISKAVVSDLNGLKSRVEDDLKRAEKDNDVIYLQTVPLKSELRTLDRANMVSSKVPNAVSNPVSMLSDAGELGRPLFSKLVPYSVHIAASIYVGRRDDTIGGIVNELEALNSRMHDLLRSLNLPGSLQALEKPLGLPPGLVSHAEEIRQQNGPVRIRRTTEDIDKLKSSCLRTFQEGTDLLESEAAEDNALRIKYGTQQWARAPSTTAGQHVHKQVQDIYGYFEVAGTSDQNVRAMGQQHLQTIAILNGTDRELEEQMPRTSRTAPGMNPRLEREVTRLRAALNDVSRLETRRKKKIETLRFKAQADDVNAELLKEAARLEREFPMTKIEAVQFEDFFDKRLERYNPDRELPSVERTEQERVLSTLTDANRAFDSARHGDASSASREREQALQRLENAYFGYKELVQNLETGRKFYNDLVGIVNKFRDDCRKYSYDRRSEAGHLEADILTSMSMAGGMERLSIAKETRSSAAKRAAAAPPRAEQREPLAAPVPVNPVAVPSTNTWTPERGITFANGAHGKLESGQRTFDPDKQGIKFA